MINAEDKRKILWDNAIDLYRFPEGYLPTVGAAGGDGRWPLKRRRDGWTDQTPARSRRLLPRSSECFRRRPSTSRRRGSIRPS